MKNKFNNTFYFSGLFVKLNLKNLELDSAKNILSGGRDNVDLTNNGQFFCYFF